MGVSLVESRHGTFLSYVSRNTNMTHLHAVPNMVSATLTVISLSLCESPKTRSLFLRESKQVTSQHATPPSHSPIIKIKP
jgi:hypothetical protein